MAVKVRKFTVDSRAGDVIVVLQSHNALPINGVLATLDQRTISPEHQTDPSVATFRLPAETGRYLVYGVITPLKRLWRKPSYSRAVLQGGLAIRTRGRNPGSHFFDVWKSVVFISWVNSFRRVSTVKVLVKG